MEFSISKEYRICHVTQGELLHSHSGELAALGTALCWSFGSIFFTISARIFGHMVVNRIRLAIAFCLLVIAHLVFVGRFMLLNVQGYHLFWFGLSGVVGFTIGDSLLFKSFVLIGPRRAMLTMSLAPVFGVIIAWLFLHEVLSITDIAAIVVTLTGISWVLLGQRNGNQVKNTYMNGILYGVGGALCQAIGLILSKKGLINNFPALDGNIIRLFAATSTIWISALVRPRKLSTMIPYTNSKGLITLFAGSFVGPFLGVWLSLVAVQYTLVGIASTLMALPPILLIPLSHWFLKEKITHSAVLGTIIALIGVALIFLL